MQMYEGDGSFMLYWHAVEGANDEGECSVSWSVLSGVPEKIFLSYLVYFF